MRSEGDKEVDRVTAKEREVKHWLNRAFYADKKAKALEMLLRQCRERAESVSICCEGNDKGKCSGSKNGTENALIKLIDTEQKLQRQIFELLDISDEISEAISKLEDDDLETVLIYRYILFHTIEETAEIMNYSTETVRRKTNKAIKKLCENVLECGSLDVVE